MTPTRDSEGRGLPTALKEIATRDAVSGKDVRVTVDFGLIRAVQQRGNSWFQAEYRIDPPDETYYYLYALERYCSFSRVGRGQGRQGSGDSRRSQVV